MPKRRTFNDDASNTDVTECPK